MARTKSSVNRITTTIKREFLAQIVAGTKHTEYREIKKYWNDALARVTTPFTLRLINGYGKKVPEITVLIDRVRRNKAENLYELHIGNIVSVKYWNRRKGIPSS